MSWIKSKWEEFLSMATKKKETVKKTTVKKVTYPELKRGSEGELVMQVQDLLSKAGSKIKIDGVFGIGTYSAVKCFQKKNGLDVTGVVDKKTWTKLMKVK